MPRIATYTDATGRQKADLCTSCQQSIPHIDKTLLAEVPAGYGECVECGDTNNDTVPLHYRDPRQPNGIACNAEVPVFLMQATSVRADVTCGACLAGGAT